MRRKLTSTRKKRYSKVINAKKLRRGRHSVRVVAVDAVGNRGTATRRFTRCR